MCCCRGAGALCRGAVEHDGQGAADRRRHRQRDAARTERTVRLRNRPRPFGTASGCLCPHLRAACHHSGKRPFGIRPAQDRRAHQRGAAHKGGWGGQGQRSVHSSHSARDFCTRPSPVLCPPVPPRDSPGVQRLCFCAHCAAAAPGAGCRRRQLCRTALPWKPSPPSAEPSAPFHRAKRPRGVARPLLTAVSMTLTNLSCATQQGTSR